MYFFELCVYLSALVCYSDLSIPTKLSLSWVVSVGKSSSVSLAFPAAIFFPSSPPEEAEPRLRAAAQAATATDTPHDCMEKSRHGDKRLAPQNRKRKSEENKIAKNFFFQGEKMRFDRVNPFGGQKRSTISSSNVTFFITK